MLLVASFLTFVPPVEADHCSEDLGPRQWICHPDPVVHVDLSGLLDCAWPCTERSVSIAGQEETPDLWLVQCEIVVLMADVNVSQVSADPMQCPDGSAPTLAPTGLVSQPDLNGDATLVDGLCWIRVTLTAYGGGWHDEAMPTFCAYLR